MNIKLSAKTIDKKDLLRSMMELVLDGKLYIFCYSQEQAQKALKLLYYLGYQYVDKADSLTKLYGIYYNNGKDFYTFVRLTNHAHTDGSLPLKGAIRAGYLDPKGSLPVLDGCILASHLLENEELFKELDLKKWSKV